MKYQIEITGMYCKGCGTLINMCLEDEGFKNIIVNMKTCSAVFESDLSDEIKVEEVLKKVFADLPAYSYKNIKNIN